ncbi:MAG: VUT family protein [Tatlockia sp.]|nr:VUT family protein [Tatlockia sp.]
MNSFLTVLPKRSYLSLTVSMMTCLILLINVSFKIITVHGMIFTASSLLCPLVATLYLMVLKECNLIQQRHILNQSLLALYLFSIGIYLLVNLPAAENIYENPAYQIVFEDIPKKFFAATLAFGLSFYLPHLLCCAKNSEMLVSPKKRLVLALFGGFAFFSIDFVLLFLDPYFENFNRIYVDSLMVSAGILLLVGIVYLSYHLLINPVRAKRKIPASPAYLSIPLYHYLVSFSVTIMLICLACEYRLIAFTEVTTIGASAIFFPFTLIASTLIGELYGYRANLRLAIVLIMAELSFDFLLMATVALPAPDFFNINPFYSVILPRRIPAGTLALFVTFVSNAMLLENLKFTSLGLNRWTRILIANIFATSLLCLVNYSILYTGVYPYDQIFNLVLNSWIYKMTASLLSLPLVLWLFNLCKDRKYSVPQDEKSYLVNLGRKTR